MEIRKAMLRDAEGIAALEEKYFSEPWPLDEIRACLQKDLYTFFIAEEDGELLGYLSMYTVAGEGDICNIAVEENRRRQGTGSALMANAEAFAEVEGLESLILEVRASNAPAIRLYEKHGFRPVGRRKNYYRKPEEDAILYAKNTAAV